MTKIKSYSDLQQSKKLAEILPLESADYCWGLDVETSHYNSSPYPCAWKDYSCKEYYIPCWSLAALLNILPEINSIPLKIEKVKAEDGYDGYYYHIEYEGVVLIPYSKNAVDACYELILKLHELNLL